MKFCNVISNFKEIFTIVFKIWHVKHGLLCHLILVPGKRRLGCSPGGYEGGTCDVTMLSCCVATASVVTSLSF